MNEEQQNDQKDQKDQKDQLQEQIGGKFKSGFDTDFKNISLENLFINLRILSKVKKGQKLFVNGDILEIFSPYTIPMIGTLIRILYSESRELTLKKIQKIIHETIDCGLNAIESDKSDLRILSNIDDLNNKLTLRLWEEKRNKELHMDNITLLKNLIQQIEQIIIGIKELESTYETDITLCSKLDLEIELLERARKEFQMYIDL
jgi:hypothetical protein